MNPLRRIRKKALVAIGTALIATSATPQELPHINVIAPTDTTCSVYPQFNAETLGFWKAEGLKVNLIPADTSRIDLLENGGADLAVIDPREILKAVGEGLPLKVVYEAYNPGPDGVFVSPDSPITEFTDLKGKRIAVANSSDELATQIALDSGGIKLDEVTTFAVGAEQSVFAAALDNSSADAFVMSPKERVALEAAGLPLREVTPTGVTVGPGPSFAAWGPTVEDKREIIEKFLRGWAKAQHAGLVDRATSAVACRDSLPEKFWDLDIDLKLVDNGIYSNGLRFTSDYGMIQFNAWTSLQEQYLKFNEINKYTDPSFFIDNSFIGNANAWITQDVKVVLEKWKEEKSATTAVELAAAEKIVKDPLAVERLFRNTVPAGWDVKATRTFTGPHDFPPKGFAAYGIVAFLSAPSAETRDRFKMICEAFVSTIVPSRASKVSPTEQMVTVWPLQTDKQALSLNAAKKDRCDDAVSGYDIKTANKAVDNAAKAQSGARGHGPFLLAWAPSDEVGQSDVLVLVVDLSDVHTQRQAEEMFVFWKKEIEEKDFMWRNGWNLELVRLMIKHKADNIGEIFFGPEK